MTCLGSHSWDVGSWDLNTGRFDTKVVSPRMKADGVQRRGHSPSSETSDHSGLGKPYWPRRILLFIPGEMAWPVLE